MSQLPYENVATTSNKRDPNNLNRSLLNIQGQNGPIYNFSNDQNYTENKGVKSDPAESTTETTEIPATTDEVAADAGDENAGAPPENGEEKGDGQGDKEEASRERGQWNNSFEFLLSIISMSVGLGNFYRFPFVAYQNGGGAFLVPYILVLTFVGRPIYLLELAIGQFCAYGQVKIWDMVPLLRGVGYGSAIGSFSVVTYYSAMMGTTFYYLFESFRATLPWTVCDDEWAGKNVCKNAQKEIAGNKSLTIRHIVNLPELYFNNHINKQLESIDDGIGYPLLVPTGCLTVSWILIFLIIWKGVESSGKAAYVTTIYPFLVIFTMLIISGIREGAGAGMLYFLTPQWDRMLDPNVWFAAVGQCFFSLSVGFGPVMNYASFNPFRHNVYRDALIVSLMDTLASFIAGLTVFATLGSLAYTMGKPVSEVITSSPGLIFIVFSDAISSFETCPQLIAVLFFTMLLTLAAGSAVAWHMAAISVICDDFPKLPRIWVTVAMCVIGFFISLIYVTPGGQFMVTLVDNFGGNVNIYILATLECAGVAWVYGLKNLVTDIEFMLGRRVGKFWQFCWGFVIPVLLTIVMLYSLVTGERLKHGNKPFPDSAIACGALLTTASLLTLPIAGGFALYKLKGSCKERLKTSLRPIDTFGPRTPKDRAEWIRFKEEKAQAASIPKKSKWNYLFPKRNDSDTESYIVDDLTMYENEVAFLRDPTLLR